MRKNDRVTELIYQLAKATIAVGESNFSISCYGSRSTIKSEQGDNILAQSHIEGVSISVNLNDTEESDND